jgi:hypothetical protein
MLFDNNRNSLLGFCTYFQSIKWWIGASRDRGSSLEASRGEESQYLGRVLEGRNKASLVPAYLSKSRMADAYNWGGSNTKIRTVKGHRYVVCSIEGGM